MSTVIFQVQPCRKYQHLDQHNFRPQIDDVHTCIFQMGRPEAGKGPQVSSCGMGKPRGKTSRALQPNDPDRVDGCDEIRGIRGDVSTVFLASMGNDRA